MLFDNSGANICSVVATLVKGRTDREGGGRKIGEKIQREKKNVEPNDTLSRIRATGNRYRRSRGRPPPLRRAVCARGFPLSNENSHPPFFSPHFQTLFVHFTIVIEFFSIIPFLDHLHMFHIARYMIYIVSLE